MKRNTFCSYTAKNTGDVLTLSKFNKFIKYLKSEEYQQKVATTEIVKAMGEDLVNKAYEQKIINEVEWAMLMNTIQINGGLIVSPKMGKRLKKVKLINQIKK